MNSKAGFALLVKLSTPAAIIACILFLPFLNKAYLIDDPYFLIQAEQIRHQFLRPLNFTICWFGSCACSPASRLAPGAALMGYFLLPAVEFGAREPVVHLLQLLVLLAAVIATVSLALRLGASPWEARVVGILLVTFPPVLALTDTAMPDTLTMSLGVIGIERFLAWLENRKVGSAVGAALALGLAPYARLHALGLIGVGVIAAAEHLRKNRGKSLSRWIPFFPLVAAIGIFLIISRITQEPNSGGALPPETNIDWTHFIPNLRSLLWGYVICFPIAALWLVSLGRRAAWLALCAAGMFLVCRGLFKMPSLGAAAWSLAAIAALCIAKTIWDGAIKGSPEFLLGIWLLVPSAILPYLHLPPKYLMVSAPAAAIAGVAMLRKESPRFRAVVLTSAIIIFAVSSLLILQADAKFAEMSRQAAAELIVPHTSQGQKVWFTGQWGIYWYAQKAGASVVMAGVAEPKPGEFLLAGKEDGGAPVLARFPRRTLIAERIFAWTGGRTMSIRHKAGLYSNFAGPLPWSWGSGEEDRFQLWQIQE